MAACLQSMCNFWKKFCLQELQKELDSTAADIANRQDESDASRKRLVEQSRDFKKNTNEDTRKIVAPLLKSFQAEVDALSKRSKFAECAFFSIYKRLIDLPDQVAVFEQALQVLRRAQKVSDLEIENKQLRETLHDYNTEFADVKNQEVTIKQLKEKLREYDDKLETTVEIRIKDKERELQRLHAKKEHQLHETQQSVAGKLVHAERKIISLQSTLEDVQSELFDLKTKYDEATSAKSDEMDLIMSELDRANEHSATSQREAEQLRIQLHALRDSGNIVNERVDGSMPSAAMEREINTLCRSNLEVELSAKEKEVAQLVVDVQKLQASLSNLRKSTALKVAQLEQELDRKNRALAVLEEKLSCHDDYEEIKRELSVLKSMEFSGPSLDSMENDKGTSLEMLLLQKNRALLKENTQLRLSNSDLTDKVNTLEKSLAEGRTTLNEQKVLITQLEEDLRNVNAFSSMFRGVAEGEPGPPDASTELVADIVKDVMPIEEISNKSAADSLLPIVQSQRERYRLRSQELETHSHCQQQQLTICQNETDKLRSDNVKLYEKIRFLQSYTTQQSSDEQAVSRYSSHYEERLDPFTAFNRKERQKRYLKLKPYDKITLSLGRVIMGNKVARTVAFFYTLILHVLVFLVLYKLAHTESCRRDVATECHQRFADHMFEVHGDKDYHDV